jgi:hypothetical protein
LRSSFIVEATGQQPVADDFAMTLNVNVAFLFCKERKKKSLKNSNLGMNKMVAKLTTAAAVKCEPQSFFLLS